MKKLFDKLKAFIDVWKIWIFILALFGTNGAQMYVHSEADPIIEPVIEKPIVKAKPPIKTIIIHKADNEYCDKILNDHKTSSQH
jgi:hypothetical protein